MKMSQVYRAMGTSKQAFHQWKDRTEHKTGILINIDGMIHQIRKEHPRLGVREIWRKMGVEQIGRDAFEREAFARGHRLKRKRNFRKTTNSYGVTRFDNLIQGKKLTGLNQVWVSDITYYSMGDRFYFLTFIMDLHSRKIIGKSVSKGLSAEETTIPALKEAIRNTSKWRKGQRTIFHSDGGGQYYDKEFLKMTKKHNIDNSMCYSSYENPHAERVIGTLKNDYIYPYRPMTFEQLIKQTVRACLNYNDRDHSSLNRMSPNEFEKCCLGIKSPKFSTNPQSQHINNNDNVLNL